MKERNLFEKENRAARPFLESVARAYRREFDDLSEFCFVFPNKRAGTFFIKHLHDSSERTSLAPEVMSISDFVAFVADHDVASRIELLFRLFNIYKGQKGDLTDFDSFRNWGETLLSDFSEVDQYNVDADSLFKNVKDYREIASSFLTDEQIEVMERYFGYAPGLWEVERFWRNMEPPSDIKTKFLLLWQQMAPLYHALNESLLADRLCTSGGAYRLALERLREYGREILPWKKVVMVGFNALSTTEALIFEELKGLPPTEGITGDYGEFFWDGTGPVLSGALNDAATFLKYNRRNFPSPEWASAEMKESDVETMPEEIHAIGAPSNATQGKIAGNIIAGLMERKEEEIKEAKVAVVLPDENLLMPLLYSLPEDLTTVNLTMGYPLRNTSVISFIYHLRKVRATQRTLDGEPAFYHEDLRLLLSHPYVHALVGSKVISEINSYMNYHHKMTVKLSELSSRSDRLSELLRPLPAESRVAEVIAYLEEVMVMVSAALDSASDGLLKSRIDRSHIEVYRDALHRLDNACAQHGVEMSVEGVFTMVDKLLSGEYVTFEGEPLEGLQVMGLLETRALDFDKLVILSLNDRVMPRKASGRTFIPDSLRHGYGLPYSNYREDLFSYYFYRMISRAREVTLIYDARSSSGMRSGGMSRYMMQLRYLYAPDKIRFENRKFLLSPPLKRAKAVEKTPLVMEQLKAFLTHGSKQNFSATALKKYFLCPTRFYYESVAGLKAENTPTQYIDAATAGNVLHDVMFWLYFPENKRAHYLDDPIEMTLERLAALIEEDELISRLVKKAINMRHFKKKKEDAEGDLDPAASLIALNIVSQVKDVLRYDMSLAPFWLAGGEISGLVEWPLRSGTGKVNMKYAIDRLDFTLNPDGSRSYRIVDYKTGAAKVKASNMEGVFTGEDSSKNLFQLMLYANLMNRDRGTEIPVRLSIYEVAELSKGGEVMPRMGHEVAEGEKNSYEPLYTHLDRNEEFVERTDTILDNIFDPAVPFGVADDEEKCAYCNLAHLCGRG